MQRTKQIVAVAAVMAILFTTAAWLLRAPQTNAVLLPPVSIPR